MWIQGKVYFRRPDVLIFVNGLPVVFIELKNSIVKVRVAYDDNLTNYKKDIPNLFAFNQICVLSNGIETRLGAFNAGYDYFFEWLKVNSEKEELNREQLLLADTAEDSSVRSFVDGLLDKARLIDYIENFIIFENQSVKIIAKNHQYHGVNNLMESVRNRKELRGKLGVFWHTQGSGKSYSMVFFTRKVKRKVPGNFTFLIITDREDLDDQIHKNFERTEVIGPKDETQPKNGKQLREFLQTNKPFIFTLIHKFGYDKGKKYPVLTTRDDIFVLVDEAHRTQYKDLAENMRTALPNANYIAFTGTPLAKSMFQYATEIRDDHKRQEFMKFCAKWQSRKGRETFLKDAQGAYSLSMDAFDTDLFTFNCANGTLHLDTMEFAEHRSSDLLTKKSPAVYNPQARCLRFESFVDEICSGDQDKARFLQKALGYALSGDTQYECFFILFGVTTRNGKGTLCESILNLMGSYGCGMKPESIGTNLYTNSHAPTEDIARLFGMRFVNISEPEKGLVLNASLVKTMTGNDTITARFLNEKSFDFKPTFKMFINTNHKPVINDMPVFLSNRIMIIPFERHFEEDEQDHTLNREFLKPENQSAILNWLIEGYKLLQKEGFNTPPSVRAAVDEYQHESDKIMQFVEEMLEKGDDYKVKTMDAYQEYRRWCSDRGYGIENIKNFNQALRRIVDVKQMRPSGGGTPTSMIPGYRLIGRAEPLK